MHAILLSAILYSLVIHVQHIQYLILINMYQMLRLSMRQLLQKYQKTNCFIVCKGGLDAEQATSMIVNGFCKEVMKELPMEFAVEAQKLIGISLEGSVG